MSIVLTAQNANVDASVAYGHVREFGSMLDSLKATTPGTPKLVTYPTVASDFVRMFPDAYLPGHPAVECRVDLRKLHLTIRGTPIRSSHHLLQNANIDKRSNAKDPPMSSDTTMSMMKGFVLGTHHMALDDIPGLKTTFAKRPRTAPASSVKALAIEDGDVEEPDATAPGVLTKDDRTAELRGNVDHMRASMRSKLACAFDKHGARWPPAAGGEDAEEPADVEEPRAAVKKRPAAAMKKPTAACGKVMKRPASSGKGTGKWKVLKFYGRSGLQKGAVHYVYEAPKGEKFSSKIQACKHGFRG